MKENYSKCSSDCNSRLLLWILIDNCCPRKPSIIKYHTKSKKLLVNSQFNPELPNSQTYFGCLRLDL